VLLNGTDVEINNYTVLDNLNINNDFATNNVLYFGSINYGSTIHNVSAYNADI
jgi:hypothetical protein